MTTVSFPNRSIGAVLLTGAAMLALLFACSEAPVSDSIPDLPPIPVIDTEHLGDEVREQFRAIQQKLESSPLDGHYNSRYARLLHAYSLYAPAAAMYSRCRTLRPSDLECVYLEALVLRQLGNTPEAITLLDSLIARKPDFPRANVLLASSYREQGRAASALPLYEEAVEADQGNLEAVYGLAMSLMAQGQSERARVLLERLHRDGRQFGIVHAALATLKRQAGDREAAAFHAAAAQRFADSKIPFVDSVLWAVLDEQTGEQRYVREAREHFKAGRLQEAATSYLQSLQFNPDNDSSHASLVAIFGELGDMERARQHFNTARRLNPTLILPLHSLGTAHMKRGEFAVARELFAEITELQPNNAEARTLAAYCGQLLGEPAQPEAFRRALQDDPTQSLAHYLLGRHLATSGSCTDALPHLRDSIRIESARTPAFIPDLVRCLVDLGRVSEGREFLESGKDLARHYNNAGAARALGQTEQDLAAQLDDAGS